MKGKNFAYVCVSAIPFSFCRPKVVGSLLLPRSRLPCSIVHTTIQERPRKNHLPGCCLWGEVVSIGVGIRRSVCLLTITGQKENTELFDSFGLWFTV